VRQDQIYRTSQPMLPAVNTSRITGVPRRTIDEHTERVFKSTTENLCTLSNGENCTGSAMFTKPSLKEISYQSRRILHVALRHRNYVTLNEYDVTRQIIQASAPQSKDMRRLSGPCGATAGCCSCKQRGGDVSEFVIGTNRSGGYCRQD